jgi:hypothetical protein
MDFKTANGITENAENHLRELYEKIEPIIILDIENTIERGAERGYKKISFNYRSELQFARHLEILKFAKVEKFLDLLSHKIAYEFGKKGFKVLFDYEPPTKDNYTKGGELIGVTISWEQL